MPWAEGNAVTTRAGIPRQRSTAWKRCKLSGDKGQESPRLDRICLKCQVTLWVEEESETAWIKAGKWHTDDTAQEYRVGGDSGAPRLAL